MGRRKAWALAWLLAAALSALLTQGPSAQGDELLVNGGFEDGVVDPWTVGGGTLDVAAGLGRDGSSAGVLATDNTAYHWVGQCVEAWPGESYGFAGYVAWPGGGDVPSAYLRISWYGQADCFGEEVDFSDDSAPITLENAGYWYEFGVEGSTEAVGVRSARVRIVVVESGATVYLDDFDLVGPPAPTASPTPSLTASPLPSPTATAGPTAVPTATRAATPPATPRPSPTASSWVATPLPVAGLINGSFEEADDEGRPLGWQKWGGVLSRSSAASWDGQFAAAFTSRTDSTKWAFQTAVVEGGKAYVLSGYALKNDANVAATYLRLSWYATSDGSGSLIDSADSTTRLTDDSADFRFLTTGPVVAPTEAASAKARLMLDPLSETESTVYFDAVAFGETSMPLPAANETATPVPTTSEESPTASATVSRPAAEQANPSPSPGGSRPRPSPTVLDAISAGGGAATASGGEPAQGGPASQDSPTRTPAALYREEKDLSPRGGIAEASGQGGGLSPMVLGLAVALPALTVVGGGSYIWWRRRARPP